MFVPIEINSDDLISQYNISKEDVEKIIDYTIKEITGQFAIAWEEQAKLDLSSTRARYIKNLRVVDEGRMSGAVILDYSKDPLVKMIEEGSTALDIKNGFAKSSKKKQKADGIGWYLTIPLKAGNPEALETGGFATILPTQIYNVLKKEVISSVTGRSQGLQADQIPSEYKIPKTRSGFSSIPTSKTFEEYKHKSSIYQGMFKQKDSVTGQNTYGSFRRVSDKSDPNAWIHPGLNQANLAEKAYDKFNSNMQTVLETSMENALNYFGL